jgi:hypothetical protein
MNTVVGVASFIEGRLVSFCLDNHCLHDTLRGLSDEYFSQETLGEIDDLRPEVFSVQLLLILDVLFCEVGPCSL